MPNHAAINRCPIKDPPTTRGSWQQFLSWLAAHNLDWGSAPVVVPSQARLGSDGSTGTQYVLAHGILTGTARHGDVVTFGRPFVGTPVVVFGDGGLSYHTTIGAASSQQRKLNALNLSSTGFTMQALIAQVATGSTARSFAFATATNQTATVGTDAVDTATKTLAAEAYDDNYTVDFEIVLAAAGAGDDTECDVTVEAKPSGGSYTTYWTANYINTDTASTMTVHPAPTVLVDGLGADAVFRVTVTAANRSTQLKGTTAYPSAAVNYTEATSGTELDATPAGVSAVSWLAFGGT